MNAFPAPRTAVIGLHWFVRATRTALPLAAIVAGFVVGCSSTKDGAKGCVAGQSIACAGVNGCSGYQVCNPTGDGYGECVCGSAGTDGGTARAFPHVGPYSGLLGAACTMASDCRSGLECITADSTLVNGQGPSSGMCLAQCLVDHDFCAAVDATARCVVLDDRGTASTADDLAYCLPGCHLGAQPASADKCRGRVDLVCTEELTGAGIGYCRPSCRSDIDCASTPGGTKRYCNLSTGLCGDAAPTGAAIGTSCDLNGTACAGGCIAQENNYAECSGVCSFGTEGCGQNTDPPYDYFCAIGAAATAGPGDLGYCAKVCDCDDDCGRTDAVCKPNSAAIAKTTGRKGLCTSKTTSTGGATANLPCAP